LSCASVPESAVFRSRISIEAFANLSRRALIAIIFRFAIENDEKISRHHGIQVIEAVVELAVGVQIGIYPPLDELAVRGICSALVDEVFAIEKEPTLIRPGAEIRRVVVRAGDGVDRSD